ncbi:hypothetical protein [Neorhodopirellula pilleata]|uniref:Uncharacterized protein n=1 Tax=Neorhodopirellula pilleata TaxID=2714738 RepID=A0A5C5ZKX9_9BACT|nr:hypothetical protein [Neorhodopirellula pilleata]TWT88049.1 hypothetical protein Pla100_57800 [Neorhodopirellula pilleata]
MSRLGSSQRLGFLSLDDLRRLQQTFEKRVARRDSANIRSVGFSPVQSIANESIGIRARFDVHRKLKRVEPSKRIEPIETVRLLNQRTRNFRQFDIATQVRPAGEIVATGVSISTVNDRATTALVVRWTTVRPIPPRPDRSQPDDPRWRWGLLTVSHLFVGRGANESRERAQVRRVAVCGDGPQTIQSHVVARGRIPGGPDVAVTETGWDRLWLSGFVREIGSPPLVVVTGADLSRWVASGTTGQFVGDAVSHDWSWQAFYPAFSIDGLGRLQHVVSYETPNDSTSPDAPFGPGSSGGVITAEGLLIGLQIAAMKPRFQVGYAQTFDVSLAWLQTRLRASAFDVVAVVR